MRLPVDTWIHIQTCFDTSGPRCQSAPRGREWAINRQPGIYSWCQEIHIHQMYRPFGPAYLLIASCWSDNSTPCRDDTGGEEWSVTAFRHSNNWWEAFISDSAVPILFLHSDLKVDSVAWTNFFYIIDPFVNSNFLKHHSKVVLQGTSLFYSFLI